MGFGGPVWHASIAPASSVPYSRDALRLLALRALAGVGEAAAGEWDEFNGYAYHLRRRLSADEMTLVGDVVDVRHTPEGRRRCAQMRRHVPANIWLAECS